MDGRRPASPAASGAANSIAQVGFGGMCGGIGSMLMLLVAGGVLQWLGNFTPLFLFAGVMHPLAWIAIRARIEDARRLADHALR